MKLLNLLNSKILRVNHRIQFFTFFPKYNITHFSSWNSAYAGKIYNYNHIIQIKNFLRLIIFSIDRLWNFILNLDRETSKHACFFFKSTHFTRLHFAVYDITVLHVLYKVELHSRIYWITLFIEWESLMPHAIQIQFVTRVTNIA